MSDEDGLEIGAVYRDQGDDEADPVDFVVGRIEGETTTEGAPLRRIAHVQIGPAGGGDGGSPILSHAPVELEAAVRGASEKVGTADVGEPFEEGYAAWREAFDAGEAGIFTLTPAEIYAALKPFLGGGGAPS